MWYRDPSAEINPPLRQKTSASAIASVFHKQKEDMWSTSGSPGETSSIEVVQVPSVCHN